MGDGRHPDNQRRNVGHCDYSIGFGNCKQKVSRKPLILQGFLRMWILFITHGNAEFWRKKYPQSFFRIFR